MSKEAKDKALKELKRLERCLLCQQSQQLSEHILNGYDVPWFKKTRDNRDIDHAMHVLNEDHYGLEEVKERIIEYILLFAIYQIN